MKLKLLVGIISIGSIVGMLNFALPTHAVTTHAEPPITQIVPIVKEETVEVTNGITRPVLIIILLLSLFGVCETAYMMRTRLTKRPAVCPMGKEASCSEVLESKYNTFFGIHNDFFGFAYYATVVLLSLFLNIGFGPANYIKALLILAITAGASMSIYLTYVQARILHAWCFWCLTSAATTWLLAIFIFYHAILV